MLTLGILADTHVPDRVRKIDPKVISIFWEARVAAILHAGDICSPAVLDQLNLIAPVHAVQGNRDIWRLSHLPMRLCLEFGGVTIGMTHGHGSLSSYFAQKISYLIEGYQFSRFQHHLKDEFPSASVVVFGHTHRSENTWSGDKLIFNPGSASKLRWGLVPPSIGLLHIWDGGVVSGEIIPLG
jgi:putative phosphoesterase